MSAYIFCPGCGGECLDVDTLMCCSDDGSCRYGHVDDHDPRDAELVRLRAERTDAIGALDDAGVRRNESDDIASGIDKLAKEHERLLDEWGRVGSIFWPDREPDDQWNGQDVADAVKEIREENETLRKERDAALAANAAAVCAWQEYGRWPDQYGAVPIGHVRWPDGRVEEIALRADQITGITRGIAKHIESLLPTGLKMLEAWQRIDGVEARAESAEAALKDAIGHLVWALPLARELLDNCKLITGHETSVHVDRELEKQAVEFLSRYTPAAPPGTKEKCAGEEPPCARCGGSRRAVLYKRRDFDANGTFVWVDEFHDCPDCRKDGGE